MKRVTILFMLIAMLVMAPTASAQTNTYLPMVQQGHVPAQPCTQAQLDELQTFLDSGVKLAVRSSQPICLLPSQVMEPDWELGPPAAALPAPSEVQASDWFINRKVALLRLDCTTACNPNGIAGLMGTASTRTPTLTSGSWADHFVGHWVSIGNRNATSTTCPGQNNQRQHMLMGLGYGRFSSSYASSTWRAYWNKFDGGVCNQNVVTSITIPVNTGVGLELYMYSSGSGYSYWRGAIYFNNAGYAIFDEQFFGLENSNYAMAGMESGAVSGNHSVFRVPFNILEQLRIDQETVNFRPWADQGYYKLDVQLRDKTITDATLPWRILGPDPDNFTSIVSTAP